MVITPRSHQTNSAFRCPMIYQHQDNAQTDCAAQPFSAEIDPSCSAETTRSGAAEDGWVGLLSLQWAQLAHLF